MNQGKATLIDINGDALPDIVDTSTDGNHRIFLNKPRTLLNLAAGDQQIDRALNLLLRR